MKKILLIPCLFVLFTARAQKDTALTKSLTEVVVTGQYKPQSVKNSVYQVKVISGEDIARRSPANLQDLLGQQLNIRFSQDISTGGSNITMMGLSGQNVKILLDGLPLVGRQGTSNEVNINQIDVNTIERIEIIEGPMSVIYGADALAGVINIISKKPGKARYSVSASLLEETVGKEYGWDKGIHNQHISASARYRNWYVSGGVGRDLFQGWKDTATGRELVWHKKDQIKGFGLIGFRNRRTDLYYRFDGLDEVITNPSNLQGSEPALDQDYITDRVMHQLQFSQTFNSSLSANLLAGYTHYMRQVYSTLYYANGDRRIALAPGAQSLNHSNGLTVRGTALYRISPKVAIQPGIDVNTETAEGERIKMGEQEMSDYAFFLTSEITPLNKLNIKPGLRFVKNSVYEAPPVVPSLNLKYRVSKNVDLRAAYARGFRAPSLRELYFDFHDGSHDIMGNTNLKAENSHSITASLSWQAVEKESLKIGSSLGLFYNDITNMIGYIQSAADTRVTTYSNIDLYKTRGANLSGTLQTKKVYAAAGLGITGRYNQYKKEASALPSFKWSPEANATFTYNFARAGTDISLIYKYTGKLPFYQSVIENGNEVIRLAETEGYHWADAILKKQLLKQVTISAGVRNLLNVKSVSSSIPSTGTHTASGNSISYGRSGFLSLNFQLNP